MVQESGSYAKLFAIPGITHPAALAPTAPWLAAVFQRSLATDLEQQAVQPAIALAELLALSPLEAESASSMASAVAEVLSSPSAVKAMVGSEPAKVGSLMHAQL